MDKGALALTPFSRCRNESLVDKIGRDLAPEEKISRGSAERVPRKIASWCPKRGPVVYAEK
jgi:hypothetical protein